MKFKTAWLSELFIINYFSLTNSFLVAGDDLGAVECTGVPLADLPHQLESTRVFSLTLAGNGLRKFPVGKLRDMGEQLI